MNWRSPRFLFLLTVFIVLVAGIGAVVVTLIFHAGHASVPSQYTITQKTVIPGNEHQIVQTYNQAAMKQDWATIYASSSEIVVAGYTEAQFAQMMSHQVQEEGSISSISVISAPQVKTNADGTTYFTISEQVTMTKNNVSKMQSLISIYILENGVWKFWFTK
jgi:hypothetical protein